MITKFNQEDRVDEQWRQMVGDGVCLGYCVGLITHFKRGAVNDGAARQYNKNGKGNSDSLLSTGIKAIYAQRDSSGNIDDLWGNIQSIKKDGYTMSVRKKLYANSEELVQHIKYDGRFNVHLIYMECGQGNSHIVIVVGNGYTMTFDRIFYVMDPNTGLQHVTGLVHLREWLRGTLVHNNGSNSRLIRLVAN